MAREFCWPFGLAVCLSCVLGADLDGEDLGIHRGLRKASNEGDAEAQALLGMDLYFGQNGVDQDQEEGIRLLHHGAVGGSAQACETIGTLYLTGHKYLPKNTIRAVEFLEKAAKDGKIKAIEALGSALYQGKELKMTEEDRMARAVHWMRKGAKMGSMKSQTDLGDMYRLGKGVKQDYKAALKWYNKVTDRHMQHLLASGESQKPSWKANQTNMARAFNTLASMHVAGQGTPRDNEKAINYFEKAEKMGNANAGKNLESLRERMKKTGEL